MNNEPVAWIAVGDNTSVFFDLDCALSIDDNPTPLYTHPAKTLTDAEFDNIFANGKRLGVLETEDKFRKAKTLTDEEILELAQLMFFDTRYPNIALNFARAILRKAQEK
jgi:hypothetical protein